MTLTALSSRSRPLGTFVSAVVTTLIATLTIAGTAGAQGREASTADAPRASLAADPSCDADGTATAFDASYDDHTDGHVPQTILQELAIGANVVWSSVALEQVDGDYFGTSHFSDADLPAFRPDVTYVYRVTIAYDDGVSQTNTLEINPNALCAATPATTVAPTTPSPAAVGSLPATGSSEVTLIVGVLAGLLTTAGAMLFAGGRRSRATGH